MHSPKNRAVAELVRERNVAAAGSASRAPGAACFRRSLLSAHLYLGALAQKYCPRNDETSLAAGLFFGELLVGATGFEPVTSTV
jgi:hypothetical protein